MPQPFGISIVSEKIRRRYTKTCNQLFSDPGDDDITKSKYFPSPGSFDSRYLAEDYLLNNGIERIRGFDNLSSAFTQLWFVSTYSAILAFLSAYSTLAQDYRTDVAIYWGGIDLTVVVIFVLIIALWSISRILKRIEEIEMDQKRYEDRWNGWGTLHVLSSYTSFVLGLSFVLSIPMSIEDLDFQYSSILYPGIIESPYLLITILMFLSYVFLSANELFLTEKTDNCAEFIRGSSFQWRCLLFR